MCLCLTVLQTYLVKAWMCSTYMTAQHMMWSHQMHQGQIISNEFMSMALHCMAPNPLFACTLLNGLMVLSHPYLVRLIKVLVGLTQSPSLQCKLHSALPLLLVQCAFAAKSSRRFSHFGGYCWLISCNISCTFMGVICPRESEMQILNASSQ
jgi:hypothetical protein